MRLPIIVGFPGYKLSTTSKEFLQSICPLGVILFSKNIQKKSQLLELIAELRAFDPEILIAIDYEGGGVCRFSADIPVVASPKAMSRKMDWEQIETSIKIMAQSLCFFDIDLNFAPVLDIVRANSAKVIQNRGFFPDPQLIRYYNKIFYKIHQKYGVHTVAKHFAGLSKISQDPHKEQSIFEGNMADFELGLDCYKDLPQNYFEQSIMTSHIIYPELDDKLPTTFSPVILARHLRGMLQYQGIVFTDCLEMGASSDLSEPEQIALKALEAGHDVLVSSGQIKDSDFCLQLVAGIRNYLKANPQKSAALFEKIKNWRGELQKHKTQIAELPKYEEVVQLNKNFIERKISSNIEKIEDFRLVAVATQADVVKKFKQHFPKLNSAFFDELAALEKKPNQTLVLVIDEQVHSNEKLQEQILRLKQTAKNILVVAISTSLSIPGEDTIFDEEWILWGKNHLLLDSLLALFKEKVK
jgi:beta-N-acetylhexosaminidase